MEQNSVNRAAATAAIARIVDLLICPRCGAGVQITATGILCASCGGRYVIRDGILLLARLGTSDTWDSGGEGGAPSSHSYQEQYHDVAEAAEYNAAYKQKLFKRLSTARENGLLRRLLQSQGRCRVILNLPCGGGRLSPQIAPFTDLIVEADIAEGQVRYGQRNLDLHTPVVWMTASAFHIPFRNAGVDGTVCCRLCHHLPTAAERERLIKELLRVSQRFVVMTFFDHRSLKNLLRRVRRPFDHKPPKMTMTVAELRQLARANGATLVACPALATLSSGHRYALMVKDRS